MNARETTRQARTQYAAFVAKLGSISRLNPDNFDASSFGFVPDKALKLEVAPVAYPIVHSLSKPSSPDSFEVFQHYHSTIKSGNDALADVMINPSHEPLLSATQLLKKPLGGARAFSLKNRTQMPEFPLDLFDLSRAEEPTIRCDGKVVNSEVNAKNTFSRSVVNGGNLFTEPEQKISSTFLINPEQALSQLPTFEVFNVTGRNFDAEFLSAFEQSQSENISFETCGTWEVVADRSFADYGLAFGSLNHATRLFNTSHSKLCWQGLPQTLVNEQVQLNVVPYSAIPSFVNTQLQTLTVSLNSSHNFGSDRDFNLSNSTANHTQQQKNTTINTLAGHLSSVQWNVQKR